MEESVDEEDSVEHLGKSTRSLETSFTLLLSSAYTTWGVAGRKRRLSAARRNAWAGEMLYRDSVSLTPLIQVFLGRPLALRPLSLVLCAR